MTATRGRPTPTRRLALLRIAIGLVAAFVVAALSGALSDGSDKLSSSVLGSPEADYRVDAEFDDAKGLLPGQLVKIAGARVGSIEDISLTRGNRARVELRIEDRFEPFRAGATCAIQPEGLIGERFVQCDPGRGRPLSDGDSGRPTVPVERTSAALGINDLFEIFDAPARDRFSVVLSSLGIAAAGRGDDLNGVIRRANPALQSTRRVLRVLGSERARLRSTATDAERVLGTLARRRTDLEAFLRRGAVLSERTARQRGPLAESIRRLPGLLDQAAPAFADLRGLAVDSGSLLRRLRISAPPLERLLVRARPLARAGRPALDALRVALRPTRRAARAARPAVRSLRRFASRARPAGTALASLMDDLGLRGFFEHTLQFVYRGAAAMSRFDETAHLLPVAFTIQALGCVDRSETPRAACWTKFGPAPAATRRRRRAPSRPERPRRPADARPRPAPTDTAPTDTAPPAPATPDAPAPDAQPSPSDVLDRTENLVEGLLDGLGGRDREPAPGDNLLELFLG